MAEYKVEKVGFAIKRKEEFSRGMENANFICGDMFGPFFSTALNKHLCVCNSKEQALEVIAELRIDADKEPYGFVQSVPVVTAAKNDELEIVPIGIEMKVMVTIHG